MIMNLRLCAILILRNEVKVSNNAVLQYNNLRIDNIVSYDVLRGHVDVYQLIERLITTQIRGSDEVLHLCLLIALLITLSRCHNRLDFLNFRSYVGELYRNRVILINTTLVIQAVICDNLVGRYSILNVGAILIGLTPNAPVLNATLTRSLRTAGDTV